MNNFKRFMLIFSLCLFVFMSFVFFFCFHKYVYNIYASYIFAPPTVHCSKWTLLSTTKCTLIITTLKYKICLFCCRTVYNITNRAYISTENKRFFMICFRSFNFVYNEFVHIDHFKMWNKEINRNVWPVIIIISIIVHIIILL